MCRTSKFILIYRFDQNGNVTSKVIAKLSELEELQKRNDWNMCLEHSIEGIALRAVDHQYPDSFVRQTLRKGVFKKYYS